MHDYPEIASGLLRRVQWASLLIGLVVVGLFLPDLKWLACQWLGLDPSGDMIYELSDPCPQPDFASFSQDERTVRNSLDMRMVLVPPGRLVMGSPSTEFCREFDERPHLVRLSRPFYLGACEVTVGQFRTFVEETGYVTQLEKNPKALVDMTLAGWGESPPDCSWRDPGFHQSEDDPVVDVTWIDAVAFCEWLSRKEGHTYRLPTEAQWEYACRAGTLGPYPNNHGQHPRIGMNAFDSKNSPHPLHPPHDDGNCWTAPVGCFSANALGLHDMHGNVWEWCSDWYGEDYYECSPTDDPEGPASGRQRSIRGGGWLDTLHRARSANRCGHEPEMCSSYLGFRVARVYR